MKKKEIKHDRLGQVKIKVPQSRTEILQSQVLRQVNTFKVPLVSCYTQLAAHATVHLGWRDQMLVVSAR